MTHGTISKALQLAPNSGQYQSWPQSTIYYNFPQTLPSYYNSIYVILGRINGDNTTIQYQHDGVFAALDEDFRSAASDIIQLQIGNMLGVGITLDQDNMSATHQIFAVNYTAIPPHVNVGGMGFPNQYYGSLVDGDVNLDTDVLNLGGEFEAFIIHEFGHALGLQHTFDAWSASDPEENMRFSIMSYTKHPTLNYEPTQLQLYDIAALQYLYGPKIGFRDGNSTYTDFHSGDLDPARLDAFSIYDAGGIDTIDASIENGAAYIDLRPGFFSSIGLAPGGGPASMTGVSVADGHVVAPGVENVSIAFGTYIENAVGSTHNDVLVGNLYSNTLSGGGGDDILLGQGDGQKIGLGGKISPFADYDSIVRGGRVQVDPVVEDQNDLLYGGDGKDWLFAGGGTSILRGENGDDVLIAGGVSSHLIGGAGNDKFVLANYAIAHDVTKDEYVYWGSVRLTGGVQLWWMEGGWAYHSPLASVLSASPGGALFGGLGILLDFPAGLMFRYGLDADGDLVIQAGRGRVGIAAIADYNLDLDTGAASGNIVAFRQILQFGPLSNYINYIKLALRAGFGTEVFGDDPLVLDLDGGGLHLTRPEDGVYFDTDADGFAERTGWLGKGDGLLARDLNANGQIDNSGELFGTAATPGFTALAALDSNADGKISSADAAFSALRIWQDLDHDGVTDAGELKTLTDLGIVSVSTASAASTQVIRGNTVRATGAFTRSDGSTGQVGEVLLTSEQTDSHYLGDSTISATAAARPELKGYGNVTDLRIAMTQNATVLSAVDAVLASTPTSWTQVRDLVDDILYNWAGVQGVVATAMGAGAMDRKKLAFLEKYFGYQLTPRDGGGVPSEANVQELAVSWNDVLDKATARILFQGQYAALLDGVSLDTTTDSFKALSASGFADTVANILAELDASPAIALTEFTSLWAPLVRQLLGDGVRADNVEVKHDYMAQVLIQAMDQGSVSLTFSQLAVGLGLSEVIVGTTGADSLVRAESGLQLYVGDAGNDSLTGGTGQDVYVFGRNFGQDQVLDSEGTENGDRVRLAFLNPDDVVLQRSGVDLIIQVIGSTDKITIVGQFDEPVYSYGGGRLNPYRGVEDIQFADGTIYQAGEIAAAVGRGTSASETLTGTGLADELEGFGGNDTLRGGNGGDIYYFTKGDGNDVVEDVMTNPLIVSADALVLLGGITAGDMQLSRTGSGDDLAISFGWVGDSILLKGQFQYGPLGYQTKLATDQRMEAVFFSSGLALSWLDLQTATIATYTTDSNDSTYGFGTGDVFEASAGNDFLSGLDGADNYNFQLGSGQDTIRDGSRYPANFASQILGYDWGGDDVLRFADIEIADVNFTRVGSSNDLLITIDGAADNVTVQGQFNGVKLDLFDIFGVAWFDRIESFQFADGTVTWEQVLAIVTTGTSGADSLYGAYYQDTLDGKGGADFLSGGDDGDTYKFGFGYGSDIIEDNRTNVLTTTADRVLFGAGIVQGDVIFTRDGETMDLLVAIQGTSDVLRIKNQYAVVETGPFGAHAFDQIELFEFAHGTALQWDTISAAIIAAAKTPGADLIVGTHLNDWLDGGSGNDTLKGGNGQDTYVFDKGYGNDVVADALDNWLAQDGDRVVFGSQVAANDIVISRYGADLSNLRLTLQSTGETLSVEGQFAYNPFLVRYNEIERFEFADGAVWTAADVRALYLTHVATAGADTITGFWTDDTIVGGGGADVLRGGDGSDIYRFSVGFGGDRIEESVSLISYAENDRVEFDGVLTSSIAHLARSGDDLIITFSGYSGNLLTIANQFKHYAYFGGWNDVESIKFADNVVWTDSQIRERLLQQAKTSGPDTIIGFYTADSLDGGAGNDTLKGMGGGDTYAFGKGSGQDTIEETYSQPYEDQPDTVLFQSNVARSEIAFSQVGNDLVISITGVSDTLTIKNQLLGGTHLVEWFRFSDGSVLSASQVLTVAPAPVATGGTDTLTGTAGADLLDGGGGNDILRGGDGSDTYSFVAGFGQDRIEELVAYPATDADIIEFGPGFASVAAVLSRSGNDLLIGFNGVSDTVRVVGQFQHTANSPGWNDVELVKFSDGVNWTDADIRQRLLAQAITAGNDVITGFYTQDRLDGGAGNDTLKGLGGGDTYAFGRGSGHDTVDALIGTSYEDQPDSIEFGLGIASEDLRFVRTGNDLVITINNTTDSLTIKSHFSDSGISFAAIEFFRFAQGDPLTQADINLRILQDQSTTGNDTITGTGKDDVMVAGTGNDLLQGKDGNDTYLFEAGFGQDIVRESVSTGSEEDRIVFGEGLTFDRAMFTRSGKDLTISFTGLTDVLVVDEQFFEPPFGVPYTDVETFEFADGIILTDAMMRDLLLSQSRTTGSDTIVGYWTDDVIDGGAGNDELQGGSGSDVYRFGRGYGQDRISESYGVYRTNEDTISFDGSVRLQDLSFSIVRDIYGNLSDLRISIFGTTDQLTVANFFKGVQYEVEGFVFNDGTSLTMREVAAVAVNAQATSGSDTNIQGSQFDDTLDGLAGIDNLYGGLGNDTYIWGRGYNTDTIDDNGTASPTSADRVLFKAGVRTFDIRFARTGDILALSINGVTGTLNIRNQFANVDPNESHVDRIEFFEFADGTIWTAAYVDQQTLLATQTDNDDTIYGFNLSETLTGRLGNDYLNGKRGADTYIYASGDGNDIIEEFGEPGRLASEVDRLRFTNINEADITVARVGNDLVLTVTATSQTITVKNQFLAPICLEVIQFADTTTWNVARIAFATDGLGTLGTAAAETMTGTTGADTLFGEAGNDTISGDAGADIIGGGLGADTLNGGTGSDILYGDAGADTLLISDFVIGETDLLIGGDAVDVVSFINLGVAVSVDLSLATGYDVRTRGGANLLTGTWRNLAELREVEYVTGSAFADELLGDAGANTLRGGAGDDLLTGRDGADLLVGQAGKDTLYGGAGNDKFDFDNLTDSGFGTSSDVIADFASGDLIDLLSIDAEAGVTGNQAFTFIGTAAFGGVKGQLRYEAAGGQTRVSMDVTGDGVSDMDIMLTGTHTLVGADFVL